MTTIDRRTFLGAAGLATAAALLGEGALRSTNPSTSLAGSSSPIR